MVDVKKIDRTLCYPAATRIYISISKFIFADQLFLELPRSDAEPRLEGLGKVALVDKTTFNRRLERSFALRYQSRALEILTPTM